MVSNGSRSISGIACVDTVSFLCGVPYVWRWSNINNSISKGSKIGKCLFFLHALMDCVLLLPIIVLASVGLLSGTGEYRYKQRLQYRYVVPVYRYQRSYQYKHLYRGTYHGTKKESDHSIKYQKKLHHIFVFHHTILSNLQKFNFFSKFLKIV